MTTRIRSAFTALADQVTRLLRHPFALPALAMAVVLVAASIEPAALFAAPFMVGAVLSEGRRTAEFLLSEAPGSLSRDNVTVTVAALTTLAPGLVLGKITASGKYVPYNNAAVDGSEVAAGILYGEVANAAGAPADKKGVVINNLAEARLADLTWNGQAQAAIDAGTVDLLARLIKLRS